MNCHGQTFSRRAFLRRSAAASLLAVPWIIPASVRGGNGAVTPSERINVGLIGRGAMGSGHLHVLAGHKQTQLVAVCDVDRVRREPGARQADEICAAQRGAGSVSPLRGHQRLPRTAGAARH